MATATAEHSQSKGKKMEFSGKKMEEKTLASTHEHHVCPSEILQINIEL